MIEFFFLLLLIVSAILILSGFVIKSTALTVLGGVLLIVTGLLVGTTGYEKLDYYEVGDTNLTPHYTYLTSATDTSVWVIQYVFIFGGVVALLSGFMFLIKPKKDSDAIW